MVNNRTATSVPFQTDNSSDRSSSILGGFSRRNSLAPDKVLLVSLMYILKTHFHLSLICTVHIFLYPLIFLENRNCHK